MFQNVPVQLLQKKSNLSSSSIGDCPPISPIGLSTATSNPNPTPFNDNRMTAAYGTSETPALDVNFAGSETSETLESNANLAVFSLISHVRNRVHTESSFIQNETSQ